MVLGAAPLAFATGAGAESREQIGWVLVGGLLLGTLLTLYVVPVAYTLIASRKVRGVIEEDAHQHGNPSDNSPEKGPDQADKPGETGEPNALGHT